MADKSEDPLHFTMAWRMTRSEYDRMLAFTGRFKSKSDAIRWLHSRPEVEPIITFGEPDAVEATPS